MTLRSVWIGLSLLVLGQGVFLSWALALHPRGDKTANRWLALVVALYTAMIAEYTLTWTGYIVSWPHATALTWGFPFLYGPLLWAYSRRLAGAPASARRRAPPLWLHALVFLAFLAWQFDFLASSAAEKQEFLEASLLTGAFFGTPLLRFVTLLQVLHLSAYGAAMLVTLRTVRAQARRDSSKELQRPDLQVASIKLNWLRRVVVLFGAIWGALILESLFLGIGARLDGYLCLVTAFCAAALIQLTAWQALRHPETFSGPVLAPEAERGGGQPRGFVADSAPLYATSGLSRERMQVLAGRLHQLMKEASPYRDPSLRLSDLAGLISISQHQLSQILNQHEGVNFRTFVNGYRVQESQRLLTETELTILEISSRVGFNSKNAFNGAFRRLVEVTPTQYRQGKSRDSSTP